MTCFNNNRLEIKTFEKHHRSQDSQAVAAMNLYGLSFANFCKLKIDRTTIFPCANQEAVLTRISVMQTSLTLIPKGWP